MSSNAVDSVLLYVVTKVRVPLKDRHECDPREALRKALEQVDLDDVVPSTTVRTPDGHVDCLGWNGGVLGALVDFQDDPEYEQSVYVSDDEGTALNYLDFGVVEALERILESGIGGIQDLRTIMRSTTHRLAPAAARGIFVHDEATDHDRREAAAFLFGQTELDVMAHLDWLESNPKAWKHLRARDLAPALSHTVRKIREKALILVSRLHERRFHNAAETREKRRPRR